jgi:hypothetical protein
MLKNCKKWLIFLCLTLVLTSLSPSLVSAATPKKAISVTYKGKTKTLIKISDVKKSSYRGCVNPNTLTKAWGKYTKKTNENVEDYIFKKGKSKVTIGTFGDGWWSMEISVKDKNMAVCGVKVGMTKAKAVRTLQSVFGKNAVTATSTKITAKNGVYEPVTVTLKSGRVTGISFFAA